MTEFQTLSLEVTDGVAVVTFTRPEQMNTFTPTGMLELIEAFDITDADDAVKAVIVTGSGRAFCAGADLSEGGNTFNYHKRDASEQIMVNGIRRDGGGRVSLRIFNSLKPVIAACNGAAVGVGATMQLPMDFRLASNTARYGFVFARRGIVPEACSSWFLPRLVGMPTALEWV
jgi:enoyl-CoA hydratase/carnithine racemase